jgi:hypothetical protein
VRVLRRVVPCGRANDDNSGEVLLRVAQVFFRIVRNETPTVNDFTTMRELGFPLENEAYFREWAEGVSVYNSLDYAIKRARATHFVLGSFVVPVCIPDESAIEVRQTFSNRRHYTIYTHGDRALALVCGETVPAREQANG